MRFLGGIFIALLALPLFATEKMTSVTVDGFPYINIQDVHVVSGGRVVILVPTGGTTVAADKLPEKFLSSWGISPDQISSSKSALAKQSEQALTQAIHAGYFREVDGVIYDLRKPQPAWKKFTDVRVVQVVEGGALVETSQHPTVPAPIFVHNLAHVYADNDKASFWAKLSGDFSYINRFGFEHTIHAYDVGRICQRNEIPESLISGFQTSALLPNAARPKNNGGPTQQIPDVSHLRGIGSGFFITGDGYLLTNFHVVREGKKVRVRYKAHDYEAKVVTTDELNDIALVKVDGKDFTPLTISHKDSADLGDSVFTIGFPNIEMQGLEPKYTDGKISSLAGMGDDPKEYQISVPVQPGNSGGPLCDANGEVVGIVVARLNDLTALRQSGAVPQNVNYAIKSRLALQFVNGVKELAPSFTTTMAIKPAKPIQTVENAIAMVMIY